jgi:hypothetical protein
MKMNHFGHEDEAGAASSEQPGEEQPGGVLSGCSALLLLLHFVRLFSRREGGESSASKRRRLDLEQGNFCVTDNDTPSQPTQGTPPRQRITRKTTMRRSPSASPPEAQSSSQDSGWGKTHSID